jgi:hypothetical protein
MSTLAKHDRNIQMIRVTSFEPALASSLPEISELLVSSNLVIHSCVSRIILHGSRGLAGGYHPSSDIDLSLIVDTLPPLAERNLDYFLRDVLEITCSKWQSAMELDLAVVFDIKRCALKCFDQTAWNDRLCTLGGVDCFGLYKVGKGFNGFVTNAGIQVKRMYPCLKIWQQT